jgi:integrase
MECRVPMEGARRFLRMDPGKDPSVATVYLTDRLVRGLEGEGGRAEAWDSVVPGLGLRYSDRKKTWFFVFHSPECRDEKGHRRRRRMTLGDYPKLTLAEARAKAAEVKEQVRRGVDPTIARLAPPSAALRFRELGVAYVEEVSKAKKVRWDHDVTALKALLPVFGDRLASEIGRPEIQHYLKEMTEKRGKWVALDHLAALRLMLEWGVETKGLPTNPARGIPRERRPPRDRVLSAEEVRRMWQRCEAEPAEWGGLMLRLRLLTGQRGTQISRLHVSQLERDALGLWWNVPSKITKTNKPNRVFLGPLAEEVIAAAIPSPDGWYFASTAKPGRLSEIGRRFRRRLRDDWNGEEWRGMDLRRTAATWMARGGVPRFIVKRVLGHSDRDITAVYDLYSYDREVKAAILILERAVREAIGEAPPAGPVEEPVSFPLSGSSPFFPQFPGLPR